MKKEKWISISLTLLFVLVIIVSLPKVWPLIKDMNPAKQTLYKKVRNNIGLIEIGMTKENVGKIMPYEKRIVEDTVDGNEVEIWIFPDSIEASEQPRCTFDKTGHVVSIVRDDEYIK